MKHFPLDLILTLLDRYVSFFWGGEWLPLCIPCRFEMPFILIVFGLYTLGSLLKYVKNVHPLTSLVSPTSQVVLSFQMSSLLVLPLVSFLLFLGIGFGLNLTPFWGCFSLVSHAFICFIKSLEPSKMKSNKFFAYLLT